MLVLQRTTNPVDAILTEARRMLDDGCEWEDFHAHILGLSGLVRAAFPEPAARSEFEQTTAYAQILAILSSIRNGPTARWDASYETQQRCVVVTVRLPESLHQSLKSEAHEKFTSMNQLAIDKLLRPLPAETAIVEGGDA